MTIIQAAKYLEQIALTSPYIRTTNEGSVYDIMNTNGRIKYGVFVLSQTQHRQDDLFDYIGFNAFVIDRLDGDLESNRLQIQSTAKEVLANIVLTFKNKFYGSTFEQLVFHPFTEKFTDLCAGVYCQLNIKVPRTLICEDKYGEIVHNDNLIPLTVSITENGIYEYKPETLEADGFDNVKIIVSVSGGSGGYESGYTAGYESGKTDGIQEQKAKLISTAITGNGIYTREDGFNSIEVSVETGQTINNQTKSIEITENGSQTVRYDNGYTGLESVCIDINVPQSAYTSGYTQEDLDNAYASGITEQKAKLISTAITENGIYTREDGYSAVTVNVPRGYTQEDLDRAYQNGYINGWNDAKGESGSTSGYTNEYLTFEIISGGTIYWYASGSDTRTIQYSVNGDNWQLITSSQTDSGNTIGTFQSGDKVRFKAINTNYGKDSPSVRNYFKMNSNIRLKVYGNIMSLLYGDNFSQAKTLVSASTFSSLFFQCNGITDAENLILPATTLSEGCYANMFNNCYNLTKAPTLPATTLAVQCYANMFYMYEENKSKLNYVKCLATDISANLSTNKWLNNVSSIGTFVKASGVVWPSGDSGIPSNWNVIEE